MRNEQRYVLWQTRKAVFAARGGGLTRNRKRARQFSSNSRALEHLANSHRLKAAVYSNPSEWSVEPL